MNSDSTESGESGALNALHRLGFGTTEAKVLVGLHRLGTATARDVSRVTDVSRPQVYSAVEGLEQRGLINVQQANPKQFQPVSPDETAAPDGTPSPDAYDGGPSGIDLWDVSDPAAPELRATIPAPPSPNPTYGGVWTTAHNFEIADDVLYSSWYQGGVKRHDVSDPAAPEEVSWWRDPNEAKFWTARPARAGEREGFFVASSMGVGDVPGRLYTFPDHAGEQADPSSVLPDREPTPVAGIETVPGTTAQTTGTETKTAAEPGSPEGDGIDISAPGFGVVAGAAGLGLAAWRLSKRSRSE
jgi:hypothetical protein